MGVSLAPWGPLHGSCGDGRDMTWRWWLTSTGSVGAFSFELGSGLKSSGGKTASSPPVFAFM